VNINLWKSIVGFVALKNYPNLPCPYCSKETLNFDISSIVSRKVSDKYKHIASRHFKLEQQRQRDHSLKQGEIIEGMMNSNSLLGVVGAIGLSIYEIAKPSYHFCKFTAFMVCESCGDNIAVSGLSQDHTKKTESERQLPALYKIDHFSTPISMFKINELVPTSIQFELLGAFSYFHIDTNSSANKLRRAIEVFCSELGIADNPLGRQINELKNSHPVEAGLLNALRLVGNEGTHSNSVLEDDLLMAFDIVEEVLALFPRLNKLERLKAPQAKLISKFKKKNKQTEPKPLELSREEY